MTERYTFWISSLGKEIELVPAAAYDQAIALLREWGAAYDDARFPKHPPYGERIREFLASDDAPS
jgi:hypothetical protein